MRDWRNPSSRREFAQAFDDQSSAVDFHRQNHDRNYLLACSNAGGDEHATGGPDTARTGIDTAQRYIQAMESMGLHVTENSHWFQETRAVFPKNTVWFEISESLHKQKRHNI